MDAFNLLMSLLKPKSTSRLVIQQSEPVSHIWDIIILCCFKCLPLYEFLILSSLNRSFHSAAAPVIDSFVALRIPKKALGSQIVGSPRYVRVHAPQSIPESATHVIFCNSFNKVYEDLPPKVTHLYLGLSFKRGVPKFPPYLLELNCGHLFDEPLHNLPPTLTHLTLGMAFNQPLLDLPPSITHLVLTPSFTNQVKLPPFLTHLVCGGMCFSAHSPTIPPSIVCLIVRPTLPTFITSLPSLFHLQLERYHPCLESLPKSITSLHFPRSPAPPTNLPPALTQLTLGQNFNHPVDHLPPSLTYLSFQCCHAFLSSGQHCFNQLVDNLPPHLSTLIFNRCFCNKVDKLPQSLKYLSFPENECFNEPVNLLPPSLTYLNLGKKFNHPLCHLPASLTALKIGGAQSSFDQPLTNLPALSHLSIRAPGFYHSLINLTSLTHLTMEVYGYEWDKLPPSVTHLTLEDLCMTLFSIPISTTLTHLTYGPRFNRPLTSLPPALTHLSFGSNFNHPIPPLPPTLTHLTLGIRFSHTLPELPPALFMLNIPKSFPSSRLSGVSKKVLVQRFRKNNSFPSISPFDFHNQFLSKELKIPF